LFLVAFLAIQLGYSAVCCDNFCLLSRSVFFAQFAYRITNNFDEHYILTFAGPNFLLNLLITIAVKITQEVKQIIDNNLIILCYN
jgi:hypothetical protein